MITLVNIALLGTLVIALWSFCKLFSRSRIPKGLKECPKSNGLPLLGCLLSFKRPLYEYLYGLKQKHGPLFKFTLGCLDIYVINDTRLMIKAMREHGQIFAGRHQHILIQTAFHNSGILFIEKDDWIIQRNFIQKVLRDFGLGKQLSQDIVHTECYYLLKEIEEMCNRPISVRTIFQKYTLNVIAKLVINSRFEQFDPRFDKIIRLLERLAQDDNFFVTLLIMYPIVERSLIISKILLKCTGIYQANMEVQGYVKEIISEREQRFNPDHEGEDLINMFLKEKHRLCSANIRDHTFTDLQLIMVVIELFVAGFDTTASTLSWGMLYLAKHPDIQEMVHNEIVDIIGSNRAPSMTDKKSMNYTQAVMDEIFRRSSVVPLSLSHRVFEATSLDGYYIPKHSIIIPNIYGIHHDNEIWEKPFAFYPEHFLTHENGELKYNPREDLMPFGMGKRQCLGEPLARLEFFIFLTGILQKYKVRFANDMSDEEFRRISVGTDGVIRAPLDVDVVFELIVIE